jgi:hypothetical protein
MPWFLENSADGTFVGIIQGSDPDGDALTYAITAGNQLDGFIVDPNSGLLSVADQTVMDFETNPSFNLTVTVSDGSLDANATISILLTDVTNEEEALSADMKAQLNIYPNPAKSMITIEGISYDLLVISDLSGKTLIKTQASLVDVSSLKTGTYMVTFHLDNGETVTKRIIKE